MKKANEEQATKFAGVFVEHHMLLTKAPSSELQWAIQNPQAAVLLFVDALVVRGKQTLAALNKTLIPWKTIKIGGRPIEEVTAEIIEQKGNEIGCEASGIMEKPDFRVAREEYSVNLVVFTPACLGFTSIPHTNEFLTKEFCAKWSAEHLDGYVIELCHHEVGPQLRLQYQDQPKGEFLRIAVENLTDSEGNQRMFVLGCRDDSERWLNTYRVYPDAQWNLNSRFVFQLRKI